VNKESYWYARGYYDGRALGVEDSLDEVDGDKNAEKRVAYKRGYDKGVADYCFIEVEV